MARTALDAKQSGTESVPATYTYARFWRCALQVNPAPYSEKYRGNEHGLTEAAYNQAVLDRFLPPDVEAARQTEHLHNRLRDNQQKLLKALADLDASNEQVSQLPKLTEQLKGFQALGIEVKLAKTALFAREKQLAARMSQEFARLNEGLTTLMRRERVWHYPIEAIREAVLNAMVHRDWTRMPEVEVISYSDRLEIVSPGALQNSMTIEKMLAGQRSPRNPLLVEAMRDYGYVEARGMGVRRKIVPLIRAAAGEDARFEATDDFLRVTLPRMRPPATKISSQSSLGIGPPASGDLGTPRELLQGRPRLGSP